MIQPGPQVACCDPPRWPSSPPALHAAGATPSPPSSANSPGRWLSSLNQLLRDKTISPCYRHGSPRLRGRGALFPIESSPPWRQMVRTIFFFGFCPWLMAGWWNNEQMSRILQLVSWSEEWVRLVLSLDKKWPPELFEHLFHSLLLQSIQPVQLRIRVHLRQIENSEEHLWVW